MRWPEVRPITNADVAACGGLLAARHVAQRRVEPLLAERYEDPAVAAAEVAAALDNDDASGWVAASDGDVAAYLIGFPKPADPWGPNMWVEAAGHAASNPEVVRDLYAAAAEAWIEDGRVAHYVIVPASDAGLVDAWFRLGFGQQHVHAVRAVPDPPISPSPGIRRAERGDIPTLAALELSLVEHQILSPVFSGKAAPRLADLVDEWEHDFDDPAYANFVAEVAGAVAGSAVGCSIELSAAHRGLTRPDDAGFLAFAAVLPGARGGGLGRALGEAVLSWAAGAGCRSVVTDWRATNLLSSRTWPRLGFVPTFYRLHRRIAAP